MLRALGILLISLFLVAIGFVLAGGRVNVDLPMFQTVETNTDTALNSTEGDGPLFVNPAVTQNNSGPQVANNKPCSLSSETGGRDGMYTTGTYSLPVGKYIVVEKDTGGLNIDSTAQAIYNGGYTFGPNGGQWWTYFGDCGPQWLENQKNSSF